MADTNFTPGPWKLTGGKHPMNDPRIPRMWWLREGVVSLGTDNEADARLCAAAPDLYAVLAEIVAQHDECDTMGIGWELADAARAALAKARGES